MKSMIKTLALTSVLATNSYGAVTYHQTTWTTGGSVGSVYNPSLDADTSFTFSGNLGTTGSTAGGSTGSFGPGTPYVDGVLPIVSQTNASGTYTFVFDDAIVDPILNITSLGSGTFANVILDFGTTTFTSIVDNGNFITAGNTLKAGEGSGSMQFTGSFTTLSFEASGGPETWTGFSIVTASNSSPIPEPSNLLLLGGLFAGGMVVRKRRS